MASDSWREATLGEFVRLQRGHDLPETDRRPGMVPIMGSAGQNGFHDLAKAKGPGVVIGRSGVGSMGVVTYCASDYWPHNTVLYVTDFLGNDERFTYYFLRHLNLRRFDSGSAQASLNRNYIYPIRIHVPNPTEQRAIAYILGTLDDKIELNRRMNETLEAMARALFKSWFVDFDPVRAKAEGCDPGLSQPLADLSPDRFEDSELGEIPTGWAVGTLADFAELNPEVWAKAAAPEEIEYVDLANTKWGKIEATQRYLWQDAPSRAQRVLRLGDTIVGTVRPGNGSFCLVAEEGLTGSTGFAALRPRKAIYSQYIYLAATLSDNIDRLSHLADGAAYPAVRPDVVLATQTVLPGDSVIECFARVAKPLMERMAENERESRTLAALRDTLLPRLISGELRVKDAERFIGRAV